MSQEVVINLRAATSADLELLQYWDKQPHVVAADPEDSHYWGEIAENLRAIGMIARFHRT